MEVRINKSIFEAFWGRDYVSEILKLNNDWYLADDRWLKDAILV